MAVTMRRRASLTRRSFLSAAGATAAVGLLDGIAKPSLSRAADRPVITHGIQSGDVSIDSGIVWARADRPARMLVEVATTDSFKTVRSAVYVDAADRLHRQGADRRLAGRAGHLLSHPFPGPRVADDPQRAAGRTLSHRAERTALGLVRVVGRYRGRRLGHR